MKNVLVTPVILCGGSGTRLWPLSRKSYPKQFLSFNSEDNNSLLQETYKRISQLPGVQKPILICNEEHRFIVAEQMRSIDIEPEIILLEPSGRGTLPAITLAALKAKEKANDSIILILSSDHHIGNNETFINAISNSIEKVLEGKLVTFGIKPTFPSTGYGYIKIKKNNFENFHQGLDIESFIEKPNSEIANLIYKDQSYYWNSGIFIFKAESILNEIKKYEKVTFELCSKSLNDRLIDLDFQRLDKKAFLKCPILSIDVAVLEKTNFGVVFPLEVEWNDIGSWDAVWKISKKDNNGNFMQGNVLCPSSYNSYLRSERRLLVTIGIKDLIVVETSDAVLVADRDYSQDVKNVVNELKKKKINEGQEHKRIYRPWGFFETYMESNFWKIKFIEVKPNASLSLQSHNFRSEHWIVVGGTATVVLDENEFQLFINQSIFIPKNSKHRLSNKTKEPVSIIEVQSGSYLGEDDILRYEDNYGRNNQKD